MWRNWVIGSFGALITVAAVYYLIGSLISVKPSDSGVRGMVTIGPVCPVQRIPPDPNCANRPYKADFTITNKYGYVVNSISSGADGRFDLGLPPGIYKISPVSSAPMPSASTQTFTVPMSGFVDISIQFDSGIR